ncbi:cyclic GMP-AMP synthase-like receptor [Galleria mellonella]|uniref:Cyclic GMP-AMP synthase-like receptor n=1 Tax=Galleria mellonella TaxID=7137 RepID=A0ABM3MQ39_GALME|nr:cyclic GMP-AMP synthase-like receptor [Galleria mellonella]
MNNSREGNRNREDADSEFWWGLALGIGAAAATVAGGLYLLSRIEEVESRQNIQHIKRLPRARTSSSTSESHFYARGSDINRDSALEFGRIAFSDSSASDRPVINNLNSLLEDLYVRFIALKDDDFELHYQVFDTITQAVGRHSDRLHIKKPNNFNMYIVIGLPLNKREDLFNPCNSDIVLEPLSNGYIKLKMGTQYQRLPIRDEWEINKTAYKWKVDNVPYVIRTSESGPAITLKITNESTGFKMDVDLVPALQFPEERWPVGSGYRDIPAECSMGAYGWMVVPEPLKKLRDALEMKEIENYHIKTLFFWEVVERKSEPRFWNKPPSELFIIMVKRLHRAMANRNIPYFWNKQYNLIEGVASNILAGYANKLQRLVNILDDPTKYKMVAEYLLTDDEYEAYKPILFR